MIGIRLSSAIRLHYLQALFAQSIHVLDSMPPGYATTTITSTSNTLQLGISEKLGVFVEFSATIIAAIIIAFSYNWLLTLVTASSIFFIALTVSILLPFIVKCNTRVTKVNFEYFRMKTYSAFLTLIHQFRPREKLRQLPARQCPVFA